MKLEIDWLKNNHQMIHYFGLGFIQLKLDNVSRLHFYTEELPPIVSEEDVHNHRYDFTSTILKGELTQEIYTYDLIEKTHIIEEESCKSGIKCHAEELLFCGIKLLSTQKFSTGSSYWIDHDTFHRIIAKNCITFLQRDGYKKEFAKIIRKKDKLPVCPFSKKIEEQKLWDIVEFMINNGK